MPLPYNVRSDKSGFRVGGIYNGSMMGVLPYCGMIIRVTAVDTTTTIFRAEIMRALGQDVGAQDLTNMFAVGWKIKGIQCAQAANEGLVKDITAFDHDLGKFTTAAMTGTYTVGDILGLIPDEIASLSSVDILLANAKSTVNRNALLIPQTTTDVLFLGTGACLITNVLGHVGVQIGAIPNDTKLQILSGVATTDICAALDIDGDAAGSSYTITGTFADDMVNTAADIPLAGAQAGSIRTPDGAWSLVLHCVGESVTGTIRWSVTYEPLEEGAVMVAA